VGRRVALAGSAGLRNPPGAVRLCSPQTSAAQCQGLPALSPAALISNCEFCPASADLPAGAGRQNQIANRPCNFHLQFPDDLDTLPLVDEAIVSSAYSAGTLVQVRCSGPTPPAHLRPCAPLPTRPHGHVPTCPRAHARPRPRAHVLMCPHAHVHLHMICRVPLPPAQGGVSQRRNCGPSAPAIT
jgi:hypothetical protein